MGSGPSIPLKWDGRTTFSYWLGFTIISCLIIVLFLHIKAQLDFRGSLEKCAEPSKTIVFQTGPSEERCIANATEQKTSDLNFISGCLLIWIIIYAKIFS